MIASAAGLPGIGPACWFEFAGDQGSLLIAVGLLAPDWLRWEPHGDLRLADPQALAAWLTAWAAQ